MGSLLRLHISGRSNEFPPRPQSCGLRPEREGFSHGLKTVPRTVFAPVCGLGPPFRIPLFHQKNPTPIWGGIFLAEQQGFEPWRRFHALRDFESRLFDQLEYCSITEVLYQHLGEKAIIFCGFYGLVLMRQISWVMVPIGQKLHQVRGLNRTFTARPMMVEVSMML